MAQPAHLPSLIQLHLQLSAALEDRLHALKMHHSLACGNSPSISQSLICQYGETVRQTACSRSNLLLKQQVEVDLQAECRLEMGRWEEKIRRLRELLASKDDEINWKVSTHRERKRCGLYRHTVKGFEQEEVVVGELVWELKTKSKLERQVRLLEAATRTMHTPSSFSMPSPQEVDTKVLRQIAREAERQSHFERQLTELLQQLEHLTLQHSQLLSRYKRISPKPAVSLLQPLGQPSAKTICSTSDDESLQAQ